MASNTITTNSRCAGWRCRAAVAGLVLFTFPHLVLSQPGEDLSKIVFDPVLLSTVAGLPVDFERRSARVTRALVAEADRLSADADRRLSRESANAELVELLARLGLTYQQLDRHSDALETFDTAIALTIDLSGRENLEQIPLHEQKIPSYLELGDLSAIDDTEDFIYTLKESAYAPASRQMYYATINLADWNTAAYFLENYRDADGRGFGRLRTILQRSTRDIRTPGSRTDQRSEEEIRIADTGGLNAILSGEARGISKLDIIDPRLRRIDRLYTSYQNAMRDAGRGEFDISIDIAKRIARLAHLTKQEMDYERDNFRYDAEYEGSLAQTLRMSKERMDESYNTGRQALEHMLSLLGAADGLPPEALAAGLLDVGDWHLTYGRVPAAREAYRQAWDRLIDAGFTVANINRALATPMPQRVPLFATHLYSRATAGLGPAAELDYRGYIDIAFTIDELGNPVDLEFLGNAGEDTERIEQLIEIQFRSIKFRPVLQDAELQRSGRIELRYNYSY